MMHFITILRPLNLLITLFCILLSAHIFDQLTYSIIPLITVILLLGGFANIINDVFDYQIDQQNQPNRPLASNNISITYAIIYAFLLISISLMIIFIYQFNLTTKVLILVFNIPLIILYTPVFKKIPLLGNLIIAFILSMVFIVTATYLNGEINLIAPSAILAFLLMSIREMVKDIADLKGDKKFGIQTFPVRYGINRTFQLIVLFFVILVFVSLAFYYYYFFNLEYLFSLLLCVLFPMTYYLYQLSKNKTSIYCIYLSKVLKLITIFGVIVIYLASI